MLGIIKDEDYLIIEVNPFGYKPQIKIPCNCRLFGEYGISYRNFMLTIYWGNWGYHTFSDFINKNKGNK